jgi:transposase
LLRELAAETLGGVPAGGLAGLLAMLNQQIGKLDQAVQRAADEHPQARLLMTQPGVGPNTALAFVLTIGDVSRFQRGKQVASYLGLIPREQSSGGKQRLGAITKQGNRHACARCWWKRRRLRCASIPEFRKQYLHRCHHKAKGVAKVAAARKLAVRLYWMLRTNVGIQRSFASRAARGCPWSAQARPLD